MKHRLDKIEKLVFTKFLAEHVAATSCSFPMSIPGFDNKKYFFIFIYFIFFYWLDPSGGPYFCAASEVEIVFLGVVEGEVASEEGESVGVAFGVVSPCFFAIEFPRAAYKEATVKGVEED